MVKDMQAQPVSTSDSKSSAFASSLGSISPKLKPYNQHWKLDRLIRFRWLALFAQASLIIFTYFVFSSEILIIPLVACLLVLASSNLFLSRLRWSSDLDDHSLIGLFLLFDIVLLSVVLGLSGGPTNPFSVLYLVIVLLVAVMSSAFWTWLAVLVSCFGFAFIFWLHVPLPQVLGGHGQMGHGDHHLGLPSSFSLHLQGMWLAYTIAAFAIGRFVSRLSLALEHERQRRLEGEKVLALAALAAGAAHEIRNPLGTIRLVTSDLESTLTTMNGFEELHQDIELINAELSRVSVVLDRLTESAGELQGEAIKPILIYDWLEALNIRLSSIQHNISLEIIYPPENIKVLWHQEALCQALVQLIRNAQQASSKHDVVYLEVTLVDTNVIIRIIDHGEGMSTEVLKQYGTPFFTTRNKSNLSQKYFSQEGMGLGVFVAKSLIERLGGEIWAESKQGKGSIITLCLPQAYGLN